MPALLSVTAEQPDHESDAAGRAAAFDHRIESDQSTCDDRIRGRLQGRAGSRHREAALPVVVMFVSAASAFTMPAPQYLIVDVTLAKLLVQSATARCRRSR